MDNKNQPAFPDTRRAAEQSYSNQNPESWPTGLTKLEYFANNAPCEIPSFFEHVSPEKNITPMPEWQKVANKEDQELLKGWLSHGFELPEELKWYSEQFDKHNAEDRAYRYADSQARYFQWRRFYAEQLLAELLKA